MLSEALDHEDNQDHEDQWANQEFSERLAPSETQDHEVLLDEQDQLEPLVNPVLMEPSETQERTDLPE